MLRCAVTNTVLKGHWQVILQVKFHSCQMNGRQGWPSPRPMLITVTQPAIFLNLGSLCAHSGGSHGWMTIIDAGCWACMVS